MARQLQHAECVPMTPRVRIALEARWNELASLRKDSSGLLQPGGHVEPSSFRKHHAQTFVTIADAKPPSETRSLSDPSCSIPCVTRS